MFDLYFVANHVFVDICFEIYFTNMQVKMYFSFRRFRKTNNSNKLNDKNRKAEVIKKANSSRTEA